MEEAFCGYPHHATWAIGSFSHATVEALRSFPDLANKIRECRLAFERCFVRVLSGESLVEVSQDLPDMEDLAEDIHERILQELHGSGTAGTRSVLDALGLPSKEG
jgi:hypothetical protein